MIEFEEVSTKSYAKHRRCSKIKYLY